MLGSIANEVFGEHGWHIVPVVDADDDKLHLLGSMSPEEQAANMQ